MSNCDLDIVIARLAMANGSGDKELDVFQNALQAALNALEGNKAALSNVAKAVVVALGSDIDDEPYRDSEDLKSLKSHII
ncbi:hypothetical protein A3715_20165 [Oleiphilus sp. HI0009]|nr:hypothetical protein A3715_15520 [Oleiphilus sp. HI0009]KZX78331.1 hypothetical protein A3715_20165 [Oleiphilus sp. HI0009]